MGIVAVGHTYLIIAGQNDLSPGSLCAFCGVAVALFLQWGLPIPVAVLLTLGCGVLCGLFNAWMVNCITAGGLHRHTGDPRPWSEASPS